MATLQIETIPCLSDNYAYLLVDAARREAAVVDPSEPEPVERALQRSGATLRQLWLTHHHWDHTGGVEGLLAARSGVEVIGSRYDLDRDRVPRQTRGLDDGDTFEFAGHRVTVRAIPGHTLGALAFLVGDAVFTGDTLFAGGYGRVFEGTMQMMSRSLASLRDLPPDTRVFCGHEYTEKNLRFAKTVEPDNAAIDRALDEARAARAAGRPTVPTTLARELETNPFLRFDRPSVAQGRDPVAAFSAIRAAKDAF
ncbi:MAG: hydroxyacylglutathione hydrolase [Myxococcales bacterium]|nr:hydroxyacylglutathione hydrolase [Myxococcales bacterium]